VADDQENLLNYSFLHTVKVEEASEDCEDVLTLECSYYESPEEMKNPPKKIKFWAYTDDAVALARLILRLAGETAMTQN
jgi:hypothetical protein